MKQLPIPFVRKRRVIICHYYCENCGYDWSQEMNSKYDDDECPDCGYWVDPDDWEYDVYDEPIDFRVAQYLSRQRWRAIHYE